MQLSLATRKLILRHTWRISRGAAEAKTYHFIELAQDGVSGFGEAAHNTRYAESLGSIGAFLGAARPVLAAADPWQFNALMQDIFALAPGQHAAKAAIDMALLDWVAKSVRLPLYKFWGLDKNRMPETSYSIGIDSPENMQRRISEAGAFPILKIKLGSREDDAIMRAVRDVTDRPVRVDANEAWRDKELALRNIEWLAGMNVEFVEQPMPAGELAAIKWLRSRSPLPLIADEDVKQTSDIPALADAYDGINIKIMKAGGLQEALRMIHVARALGLKIMLGCMVESSLGITAAAHLAPLVDWVDLDGNLLVKNDPFHGAGIKNGRLVLPDAPGIGATLR